MREDIPKGNELKLMKESFGEKIYKINSLNLFAKKIQEKIGARKYFIRKVQYSNSKTFYTEVKSSLLSNSKNGKTKFHKFFIDEFDHILNNVILCCAFIKPLAFKPENEVRIIFEMDRAVDTNIKFECPELLKCIDVVDV